MDHQIDLATTEPEKIRIVDRETRQLPSQVASALRNQARANFNVWVDIAGRARPEFSKDEIHVTVHAVLALINSISLRRNSERIDPTSRERLREMAMSCFRSPEAKKR